MFPVSAVADTGALLAVVDRSDRWHRACVTALDEIRLPMATSMAVLTELFHLVGGPRGHEAIWNLLASGALRVVPLGDDDLADLRVLMDRYADRPMDLADATVVLIARREGLSTVFTVDHGDFETYRIEGRKRFRILPPRSPRARSDG